MVCKCIKWYNPTDGKGINKQKSYSGLAFNAYLMELWGFSGVDKEGGWVCRYLLALHLYKYQTVSDSR